MQPKPRSGRVIDHDIFFLEQTDAGTGDTSQPHPKALLTSTGMETIIQSTSHNTFKTR